MKMIPYITVVTGLLLILGCAADGEAQDDDKPAEISEVDSRYDYLFTGFETDKTKVSIDLGEVLSGGPPKDGIPAVDQPSFVTVEEADSGIGDSEPVLLLSRDGSVKVYPLQILMWHEIVNDVIGDLPVSVTFCPLCNTGIGFIRRIDGTILDFGTTGKLRYSNLIMYDRQTESWWQQATGEGIAGTYTGKILEQVPVLTVSWKDVKEFHENALVLSTDTGFSRPYGQNPYSGYDRSSRPFLYQGPDPEDSLGELDRVVTLMVNGDTDIVSYRDLEKDGVIHRTVGGVDVVLFWESGTSSALDTSSIADGRDVGTANAFRSSIRGKSAEFTREENIIRDTESGSIWNSLGIAVSGPLAGERLEPVPAVQHFWFSAYAFFSGG